MRVYLILPGEIAEKPYANNYTIIGSKQLQLQRATDIYKCYLFGEILKVYPCDVYVQSCDEVIALSVGIASRLGDRTRNA